MKKTLLRAVSFLLLLCFLQLPCFAAEEGETVTVPNASFEETEGEWAVGWSHMNTEDAVFEVDTSKANTGKNSLFLSTQQGNRPWAATQVIGLEPGSFYALSVFINADLATGAGTKLEFYSTAEVSPTSGIAKSNNPNTYPNGQYFDNTNNRFVENITIFQVPEGTYMTKIYLRLFGVGRAWFDDVSLTYSGGPDKYKFDTDKVFHYKEETGGDAFVTVNNFYEGKGVAEDTLVDFAVYDGETVCEQAENVPVSGMEARYTYSTSYMKPYEKYTLKCKIKNRAGNVLEEHEQNLYVVDRPSMMSEDGSLLVDGKRFNPIIAYHVYVEDYPKAVEAGINAVQVSWGNSVVSNEEGRNATLAGLEESGLKGIFCLYVKNQNAGHPDVIENTKEIVEIMKDNTNIIAYSLQDEAFLKGDDPDRRLWCEEAYLAIRMIDKTHPIYLCDKQAEYITTKYCDILCGDYYAMGGDTSRVTRSSRDAYAETKDKNKFWVLAALFYNNGSFPTMNDGRNSAYRAFEDGATGYGFYSFSDAGGKGSEKQQLYTWDLWQDFCTFNHVEAPILFDRFVNGKGTVYNEFDDGDGDNGAYSMRWFDWIAGDDMYLVAHNRGRNEKTVTIPLQSKNGKSVIEGFKAEPIGLTTQKAVTGSGEMTLTLGSEEIALYKITPDQKVDLSRLNETRYDDLDGYDWAKEAIEALDARHIVNTVADGKYAPGEAITRLDFVSFLVRALGLGEEGEAFPDCDAKEIKIARKAGITMGDTDGNFRPTDTITRQDIMTTAARALSAKATDKEIPAFSDREQVSDYAEDAVRCMVQNGVIVGNGDGTVNPLGLATRAEAAVMLWRILNTKFEGAAIVQPAAPAQPAEPREEIEFSGSVADATLAKWNEAAALMSALEIGSPAVEKSVTKGDLEEYITKLTGAPYDAFADDMKALPYNEAVEQLIRLLGYEAYAESRGGYLALAAQLGLTKGVTPTDTYIRGGELALLFQNAFDIKTAARTAFGSSEEYAESDDTLLSLYQNTYKYQGLVEDNYYTNKSLKKNEVMIGGEVFTGGEDYLGQRVIAYAQEEDGERTIRYIKSAKNTEVITLDAKDILSATASVIRYENEKGTDVSENIAGATAIVNGDKKKPFAANDILPDMGTVTLIKNGSSVETVIVEKYENRIVQSVYKDENIVYFKDGTELTFDQNDRSMHCYTNFDVAKLKEWNVLSLMYRADGTLYKALCSTDSLSGAVEELSGDEVRIGEETLTVAKDLFGELLLGESIKVWKDFAGKAAAVDTSAAIPEYGYLTAMAQNKGIDGAVSLRIFTKQGEMKVFTAADKVTLNGTQVDGTALLTAPVLLTSGQTKQQLIVYEVNDKNEVTELKTALDAKGTEHKDRPDAFSLVYVTDDSSAGHYAGYVQSTLASSYRITDNTLTFVVPEAYSEDERDYSVTKGKSPYTHGEFYANHALYDWDKNYAIGAVVHRVSDTTQDVNAGGTVAVVLGLCDVLDDDGNVVRGIRVLSGGQEIVLHAPDDFRVVLNNKTLTDIKNGETEVTVSGKKTTLNPNMPVSALSRGDVVLYALGGVKGDVLTGMRVLLRANSPKIGESSTKGISQYYFYSDMLLAYGEVTEVLEDGIAMVPAQYERMFLHYSSGSKLAPVIIYDRAADTIKVSSIDAVRVGDMAFCQKTNPYTRLIVVYR